LEMKLALAHHLLKRFPQTYERRTASCLSAAVVNRIFSEQPEKPDAIAFLEQNRETVDWWARSIASDKNLSQLITGAVYSLCYARHIECGGKTS